MRFLEGSLFLILFFVLIAAWVIAWAAFHITAGMIHVLLLVAVLSLVLHFVRGRSAA